jgi:signal transduction histidine kinase/CheY-like chemotaxis protein
MDWTSASVCAGFVLAVTAALWLIFRLKARLAAARIDIERLNDEIWELRAAAAQAQAAGAASDSKSRFLATVTHEIRTPLNGILGMADLLSQMRLGPEAQSYLAAISTSGAALGQLIDEILDFSRIGSGKLEIANQPFSPAQLAEGVAELLGPRAQGKGLEIAVRVDEDAPSQAMGDSERIRQILINLAGNAIKFTDAGGVGLTVSVEGESHLLIGVHDTGPGVPAAMRDAIFGEFERVDGSATARQDGAGLGLAISRGLAERMGGALTLEASGPAGSTFLLRLPLVAAEGAGPSLDGDALAGRRALVIGAGPYQAEYLEATLAAEGATALRATSAETARAFLSACGPHAPDFVLIDCALGDEAAGDLARAARSAGARSVLVLVSPFERRALDRDLFARFDGWLVKPVRPTALARTLNARLERSPADGAPAQEEGAPAPARPLIGRRVLLAEDNDINALIVRKQLERAGAEAVRVADGDAALAALTAPGDSFDVALLDIRMPRRDGLGVATMLRAHEARLGAPPLPLLALTANAAQEDRAAARAAGFDRFLVKPCPPEDLVNAVASIIDAPMPDTRAKRAS